MQKMHVSIIWKQITRPILAFWSKTRNFISSSIHTRPIKFPLSPSSSHRNPVDDVHAMYNTGLYSSDWNLDYTRIESGRSKLVQGRPPPSLRSGNKGRGSTRKLVPRGWQARRSGPSPYHVTIRIIKIHKARLAHSHFSTPRAERAAHHIFIDALECTHASRCTPYATRCIDFGAHLSVPGRGYPTVSAKIHTYIHIYIPFLPPSIRGQKRSCGASIVVVGYSMHEISSPFYYYY